MKSLIEDNRGNILLSAIIVLVGMMIGLAVYGAFHSAEAVVGGQGNVTLSTNPHNFSAGASSGSRATAEASSEQRVCIFCHTSHGAKTDSNLIDPPLWNHSLSSAVYNVLSAGVYNSLDTLSISGFVNAGIVNMLSSPEASPDGTSRLCLGCHDGTIAIGDVGSESVAIAMNTVSSTCLTSEGKIASTCSAYIGNDLTQKHVVSIAMNDNLIDESVANCTAGQTTYVVYPWDSSSPESGNVILRPTLNTFRGNPGVEGQDKALMPVSKYSPGYYYGVQCSTCHDPHWWKASPSEVGYKFLVTSSFDNLCTSCHEICTP